MSSRSRLSLFAFTTAILACSGKADDASPDSAAEAPVPPAIDTTVPTILGVAINRTPGAAGWCMLSSHRDVWVGRPIKVVFTAARKIHNTKVGDTIPACPGPEVTPGAKAYELTFENEPPVEGFPAIVLRNDVWGNIGKDLTATFDLDGDQKFDTITVCTTGSVARFHMVYAGEVPRRPWKHELPYGSADEPLCPDAAAAAAPADENAPVMHMAWATLPSTYQPPYGEMWYALSVSDAGSQILKTPVLPMTAEGSCKGGGRNGKRLVAAAAPQGYNALLLRVPGITEGKVEQADKQYFGGTLTTDSVQVTLKGQTVMVRREPMGTTGFRITAQVGPSFYTLFETPTSDIGRHSVNWAGDMDRDGEIDFILLAHPRNWQTGMQLHLSSQRTDLVWPPAATFLERAC